MRTLITICFISLSIIGFSQDPVMQKNNESLETIATSITDKYDDKLALDAKQFMLFQKKVEEFFDRNILVHTKYQ